MTEKTAPVSPAAHAKPSLIAGVGQWPKATWGGLAAGLVLGFAIGALTLGDDGGGGEASLWARIDGLADRMAAETEQQAAVAAGLSGRLTRVEDGIAGTVSELASAVAVLQAEGIGLAARVAAVEDSRQPAPAAAAAQDLGQRSTAPRPGQDDLGRRLEQLERGSIDALGTLDQQLQAINEEIAGLRERDLALAKAVEDTRIALDAQLVQWRDRQTPPLIRLRARLAGRTVQFTEGNRLANAAATEAVLGQVVAWLLEAGPDLGLRVVGYADIDGSGEPSNRITSQNRADAVRDALLRLGAPAERLVAVGRSAEGRLVNDDAAGNANRRVEFEPFFLSQSP